MSTAARFLTRLAHALSSVGLYAPSHPARRKGLEEAHRALTELVSERERAGFTFLDDDVVFDRRPLRELKQWVLAERLGARGVERVEFEAGIGVEELGRFLEEMAALLTRAPASDGRPTDGGRFPHIRYGPVSDEEEGEGETPYDLYEQMSDVEELHDQAARKQKVSSTLVGSVVRTLAGTIRSQGRVLIPLAPLKEFDQYTTVHSMNTSVLTIAMGEFLRLSAPEVRQLGEAALVHDVGKVVIPAEILNKPGALSRKEWEHVQKHPVEGARILLKSGEDFDVAAIAAYEHHLTPDGGGYPRLEYPRVPHRVSQLIHICDAYDAMRTKRPFEDALPEAVILDILMKKAGTQFDPDLVGRFVRMMREWRSSVTGPSGSSPDRPRPGGPIVDPVEEESQGGV
ncbi:MAG: HD domain-containing protein [bacterium]